MIQSCKSIVEVEKGVSSKCTSNKMNIKSSPESYKEHNNLMNFKVFRFEVVTLIVKAVNKLTKFNRVYIYCK